MLRRLTAEQFEIAMAPRAKRLKKAALKAQDDAKHPITEERLATKTRMLFQGEAFELATWRIRREVSGAVVFEEIWQPVKE